MKRASGVRLAALLVASACLGACGDRERVVERELATFGTAVRLEIYGVGGAATADEIERLLGRLNRDWYAWGSGKLGELNADLRRTRRATADGELAELIAYAVEMRNASNGRFDPFVGALTESWRFHDGLLTPARPDARTRDAALAARDVRVTATSTGIALHAAHGGSVVDLGGIAKGAALARCLDILRRSASSRALVDIGGDVIVHSPGGARAFVVGIQNPRGPGVVAGIRVRDGEAVVTSGDYARARTRGTERWHHVLDPATGEPSTGVASVTVVSTDPLRADAMATALMMADPVSLTAEAAALGVDYALLVDANGALHLTTAMAERVELTAAQP